MRRFRVSTSLALATLVIFQSSDIDHTWIFDPSATDPVARRVTTR